MFNIPDWDGCIPSSDSAMINLVVEDDETYALPMPMYNEYILVGAMAKRAENVTETTKVHDWWERFIGNKGPPSGMITHGFPKQIPYGDGWSLGFQYVWHVSSFLMVFPYFQGLKTFTANPWYRDVFNNWLKG